MKLRKSEMITVKGVTVLSNKDRAAYKSSYSVCLFTATVSRKITVANRAAAKREIIRLLTIYTGLNLTQIMKLLR
jgi:hypothetical protein